MGTICPRFSLAQLALKAVICFCSLLFCQCLVLFCPILLPKCLFCVSLHHLFALSGRRLLSTLLRRSRSASLYIYVNILLIDEYWIDCCIEFVIYIIVTKPLLQVQEILYKDLILINKCSGLGSACSAATRVAPKPGLGAPLARSCAQSVAAKLGFDAAFNSPEFAQPGWL